MVTLGILHVENGLRITQQVQNTTFYNPVTVGMPL